MESGLTVARVDPLSDLLKLLEPTSVGSFKTEVIRRHGSWRGVDAVEHTSLEWFDWFDHRWLREPLGNVPLAELESALCRLRVRSALEARLKVNSVRQC